MQQVHVWPGLVLYLGPTHDPRAHRHYALQAVAALEGTLEVELPPAAPFRCAAVRIPVQARHRIVSDGLVAMLLLESDRVDDRATTGRIGRQLPEELRHACRALALAPTSHEVTELRDALLGAFDLRLRGDTGERDARVDEVLRRLGAADEPALDEVAAAVGLSAERCRHLFRDAMGLPFSRYKLWRRVLEGAQQCIDGASGTTSAHGAGFADSAHFSRTFRQTFGLAPSTIFHARTQFFVHARLRPSRGDRDVAR